MVDCQAIYLFILHRNSTLTSTLHFHLGLIQPSTSNFFTCECGHGLDASGTHLVHCPFGSQWIVTHDAIRNVMYTLVQKSRHVVWKEWWYALTSRDPLGVNLYMTREDQVFIVDVVVTKLTWETMVSNVISRLVGVTAKLSTIVKIHKYKGFQKGHHFIPMAMEVHNTFKRDMDCFIRECARLFHDRRSGGHLSLSFCI